jgi:hypothetical protein
MARMPSTRSQPLNPRLAGASVPTATVGAAGFARTAVSAPAAQADPVEARAAAARAGGFHESSYELQLGLEVSESEWPDDTTMPGSLGER